MDKRLICGFVLVLLVAIYLGCAGGMEYRGTAEMVVSTALPDSVLLEGMAFIEEVEPISGVDSAAANRASRYRWGEVIEILETLYENRRYLTQSEQYLLAVAYEKSDRFYDAVGILKILVPDTSFPLCVDATIEQAKALAAVDSLNRAIAILDSVVPSVFYEKVLALKIDLFIDAQRFDEALETLDTLVHRYPWHYSSSSEKMLRGRLSALAGDTTIAVEIYKSILATSSGRFGFFAAETLDRLGALAGQDLYRAGKAAINNKNWSSAERYLVRYLDTGEKYNLGDAEYYRARAVSRQGRYSEAIAHYNRIIENKSYNSSWANLGIAYCYRKLGHYKNAGIYLKKAITEGKGSNAEAEALWEGVELAEDMGDYVLAGEYARDLSRRFPRHSLGDNGAVWAGVGPFVCGDYDTAAARFAFISQEYSDRKFTDTGKFWQGLSLVFSGDTSGFRVLHQITDSPVRHYYRYLASEVITGISLPRPGEDSSGEWKSYGEAIIEARETLAEMGHKQHFLLIDSRESKRPMFLANMGLIADAESAFVDWMKSVETTPSTRLAFLSAAYDWGLTGLAYKLALQLVNDLGGYSNAPVSVIRLAYPTFYEDYIRVAAGENGIDPAFLFAIIRRESAYDPHAVSPAGAVGLCQFMFATARTTSEELGETGLEEIDLYDWELSIRYSARHVAGLLRKHELAEHVLAEYNAGPGPTARWKKTPHESHRAAFVEAVDFYPTRHYIKNVLGDYYAYKELWDGGIQAAGK